ncbi:MAG TPA: hypothetical protein VFC23_18430 [Thermoanaerobaculia bacterium]|nr:hypothetical protein [Thermoanaerobaculia bacterium]
MHSPLPARKQIGSLLIFLLALLTAMAPARAQVTTDTNHHYLDYNGVTTPLIGMSSEYLPHVTRPGKQGTLCTWESYLTCLNDLQAKGLNKMQLWVSLNSSIGLQDCNTVNSLNGTTVAVPYNYEQPFFWNGSKWRLDRYETNFWSRLNQVITDAGNRNIVVEVTLFDPWDGLVSVSNPNPTSPWNANNNIVLNPGPGCGGTAGFTDIRYLVSYENGTTDGTVNACARTQQMALITFAAQQLNAHTNFYWNIANEVDLVPSGFNAPTTTGLVNWLNAVARQIASVEGTASYPNTHLMGVNVTNQATVTDIQTNSPVALDPHITILDGHYVKFNSAGSVAAIPLLTGSINSTPAPLAFGFNESRSTPCPNLAGARAEAWEFMSGEGATYDNYNLSWNDGNTLTIQGWLANLKSFLSPFTLTNFGTLPGSTLAWAPGLPSYGSADGTGTNFYWGAMQWTRNQYALYMHHSTITTANAARYAPPATCQSPGFQTSMNLSLGSLANHFKAEWIFPSTGAVACTQDVNYTPGTTVPVTSPHYRYDLALRLTRCPSSAACAPVQSCSTIAADACPPADPASCPAGVPPNCPTPHNTASCPYAVPGPCIN